jgi:hypothetical protein
MLLVATLVTFFVGGAAAWAVSDGQYDYKEHHCTGAADDSERPDLVEPGCATLVIGLHDGDGPGLLFVGLQQTKDGENVDPSAPIVSLDPTGFDPHTRLRLYFGADDNLDTGEHDSSPFISNGPSDGGAIVANYNLFSFRPWFDALKYGDIAYLLAHPVPLLDFGMGACADGICLAATTTERVAYVGGDRAGGRQPVADYSGKNWDPDTCGGPSDTPKDCGPGGIEKWHKQDGVRTTEPGVQVYEDPDPQASPLGPYPLPAAYVGTCGVIVGGGDLVGPPDTPITNSAGQLTLATGC